MVQRSEPALERENLQFLVHRQTLQVVVDAFAARLEGERALPVAAFGHWAGLLSEIPK